MKISKRDDFSLIFMSLLARYYPDKFISLTSVAKETNLSALFLKHIAMDLKNKGLIQSREGIGGGYKLSKNPDKITVAEIISATSNRLITPECTHHTCRIKTKNCSCYNFWDKVNNQMLSIFNNISLSEFSKK